jgi:prepilin signal peptidase PulO-like enzyme (type II secretory pathway)
MDSLIIYFLPTIIALGIVTSYEDIKEGKIRNKYVAAGLALSILIHSALLAFKLIDLRYIGMVGLYTFIALIIGVLLWMLGLWSAGDAKLYLVLFSLIPLTSYKHIEANIPIFTLLANTILPVFAYLLVKLLAKTTTKEKLSAMKKTFNWKYIATLLLMVFSISWLTTYTFSYFGMQTNYIYNIITITLIGLALQKFFKENTLPLLALVGIIRIFLNTHYLLSWQFLVPFVLTVLGYSATRLFLFDLSDSFTEEVNIYKLKEGMIPAEAITRQGLKENIKEYEISGFKDELAFFLKTRQGITKEEIEHIKKAHLAGKMHFNELKVKQTIPFAPFLFLGTLITIICQGNAIIFLRAIF